MSKNIYCSVKKHC